MIYKLWMATRQPLPISFLRECFNYNSETGLIVWKQRPVEHFASAEAAAYGIRFHGRTWLKFTKLAPLGAESYGWRPYSWTRNVDEAEKWGSEDAARNFAERLCRGPFEIAKIRPNQRSETLPA